MDVRLSNGKGTIEISHADKEDVAAILSVFTSPILNVKMTDKECETIKTGKVQEKKV